MSTQVFKKIAVETALEAGDYVAGKIGRARCIRYKSEINAVTEVDRKAEDIIVSRLRKHFPQHDFLAEEGLYVRRHSGMTWIIDPLDGTTNFLHGFPFFCVSIALAEQRKILLGIVYDPIRKELFCAEKKKGAYLNGRRIRVSGIRRINRALVATGFTYNIRTAKQKNIRNFTRFLKASQAVRRAGSAALDLCYVACGRFDGFWEYQLNPWDTAAGVIITEEAGGRVTKVDGSAYDIFGKEILASNAKIHTQMTRILL